MRVFDEERSKAKNLLKIKNLLLAVHLRIKAQAIKLP